MAVASDRTPTPVTVAASRERAFRFARHGLLVNQRATPTVHELALRLVGLHAARQTSPWVALRTRLPGFAPADLRRLLLVDRRLIKVRCMRQTLHILPTELAATAHHATLPQRVGPCRARLRRLGRSERTLRAALLRIREEVAEEPLRYRELEARLVEAARDVDVGLARLAIKWSWESGELVHVDLSPSLHHEHRAFARTARRFPGVGLQPHAPDPQAACDELVHHHVRAFGPVSIADTAWWTGLARGTVIRAIQRRPDEYIALRVDGIGDELVLHADCLEELRATEPLHDDHVSLTSYEDPALKGYFASRGRYVEPRHYPQLFNSIGEVRAGILRGGRAVGVWHFDRRTRRVRHRLLVRVPAPARAAIAERLLDMEDFLRSEPMLAAPSAGLAAAA